MCTWNVGDHGTKDNLKALMDDFPVLCLQEMSDRDSWYQFAHDKGWKTFNAGGDDGRAATPVFWNPKVMGEKVDTYCEKLSPSQHCPGTGPDQVKTKWLIGVAWRYPPTDTWVRVGCLHLVSDSSGGCRHKIAHDELVKAAKMWKGNDGFPPNFCCIAGDFNTSWNNDLLGPMRDKNWKPAQGAKGGPVHTHGNWTPDQQWYRNGSVKNMGKRANGSDHDAYWVTYSI